MMGVMLIILILSFGQEQVLGSTHFYPECQSTNHVRLQEPGRKDFSDQPSDMNDGQLNAGWYRINGQAGNRLLDISDLPKTFIKRDINGFYPCGRRPTSQNIFTTTPVFRVDSILRTDPFYVLTETHPTKAPARIKTTATACRYNATQRRAVGVEPLFPNPECETVDNKLICFWLPECRLSEIDISVTNCGDFYVYYLHPTTTESLFEFVPLPSAPPVYCTTEANITKETPCSIYVNVTDPTRFWESRSRSVDAIQRSCQNYEFPFWTRFLYSNTSNAIIPQNCTPAILNKGNPPCGALYRGRIQGEHPSTEDGRVTRTVCFSMQESCICVGTTNIDIVNCGGFFIYKTPILHPRCFSRLCLEKQTETSKNTVANYATMQRNTASATAVVKEQHKYQNLCKNYVTIIDDSRLFSNPYREYQCDFFYKRAVRFISSKGSNLQLKENCNTEETNATRYYCGGNGLTYLEQPHPNIADGPTQISVCLNTFFATVLNSGSTGVSSNFFPRPSCKCNYRQNILVQNCSGFYIYQLHPVAHPELDCPARYCTEESSTTIMLPKTSTISPPTTDSVPFNRNHPCFSSDLCSDKLVGQPNQAKYFVYQKDKRHFYACIRNSGDTATINLGCLRCPESLIYSPPCRQCLSRLDANSGNCFKNNV